MGKIILLTNGAGINAFPHTKKNEAGLLTHTMYKN